MTIPLISIVSSVPFPMKKDLRTPLILPEQIDGEGILIGWSLEHENHLPPIGFNYGDQNRSPENGFLNPILFDGEGHLMTIAPTGAGKGTGCIIPTLLRHKGPVIVIDPKGENVAVTARQREALGQKVIVLDPMGICDRKSDHLNPIDILQKDSDMLVDDIAMLMGILIPENLAARDQFWVSRAQEILIGIMLHLIIDHDPKHHNLGTLRRCLNQDGEKMAILAKAMVNSSHPDVQAAGAALSVPAPETLGGILSFAQNAVGFMRGELVRTATNDSTFSFDEITKGDPLSIYLVIPPEKLESHGALLKLWIGSMIAAITRRQAAPPEPTLFILDEAAQLGSLPQLRQAITLLRGYGLQTWSFWQDVSQLQRLYPADWETMTNNCKVLQAFGAANMNAANSVSKMTGYPESGDILDLDYNEMILLIGGDEAVICQRPDYLKDPLFYSAFDENPRHREDIEIMPKPRMPQRVYERESKPPRPHSGDTVNPPTPLWSKIERNALDEAIGIQRLKDEELSAAITKSFDESKLDSWPMPPMVEGDWNDLPKDTATHYLLNFWPKVIPNFGYGIKGIDAVRLLKLDFYPDTCLCEARCYGADGFFGHLCFVVSIVRGVYVHLTGSTAPIHQLNRILPVKLNTEEQARRYLKFFCASTQAEMGVFRVVENISELRPSPEAPNCLTEEVRDAIKPLHIKKVTEKKSDIIWKATCTMEYADGLFDSEMAITKNGMVSMDEDRQFDADLKLVKTTFDKGARVERP